MITALTGGFIARAQSPGTDTDSFTLPAMTATAGAIEQSIVLVTHSIVPIVPAPEATVPLLDAAGAPLGPKLDEAQFCELAADGSGVIDGATYRVIGTARYAQVGCQPYFARLARKMPVAAGALGRSLFERIETPHGLGARDYRLVPWRSIATNAFALGTSLYLGTLRGTPIGAQRAHDGYVFVADRLPGGSGDQVSLLSDATDAARDGLGTPHVAVIVRDARVQQQLEALHRAPLGALLK